MRHSRSILNSAIGLMAVFVVGSGLMLGMGPVAPTSSAVAESLDTASRVTEFDSGGLNPVDVVAGADGSVWIASYGDKKILHLDASGNPTQTIPLPSWPSSLVSDGAGGVWATEPLGNSIAHVSATAALTEVPIPTMGSLPESVFDGGDFVFFAESNGHLGRLTESTGHIDELAFTGATSPVKVTGIGNQVWVVDDKGDTWVLDRFGENPVSVNLRGVQDLELFELVDGTVRGLANKGDSIVEFSRSATDLQTTRVVEGRDKITGLARHGSATWFADAGTNTIGWTSGSEAAEYSVPSAESGLSGMTISDDHYVWSAERVSGKVVRIDTSVPDIARIGGADRYEVAVNVSKAGDYRAGDGIVFVVSGENFADALSAGPAAAARTAPLLLTTRATLPDSTRAELARLTPRRVIVVGGPAAISPDVFDAIESVVPAATVERIGGVDRYAVSRALLTGDLRRDDSPTLYVATGQNYPDALSSTAAAAHLNSSILLVNGAAASLSPEEMSVIGKFSGAGKSVKIAGGTNAVSAGIEAQIGRVTTVERLDGADRYEVSQAIVRDAFAGSRPSLIYFASGASFPDALAGGVGAALKRAPVLLTHPDCVPQGVLDIMTTPNTRRVTLLGGPLALHGEVEALTPCH